MALKDKWINKIDDVDDVMASDVNDIAKSAIKNEEAIEKLQNHFDSLECFDGYIDNISQADGINNTNNPRNLRIFRVGKDNGKGEGGILIVSGDTNTLYEHRPLDRIRQTYITHDGYIKTRYAINWDSYDGIVFEWSEWESRYLTHTDITELEELNARNAYFSTSLAAGNVDYEIIAYDMTGVFGGLVVEPLTVVVSPDNVGVWESLSIVYADINGVRCKLNRSDFATNDLTANQINGYTGDKKDWFVYWYIGSDYDFNSEELNTGKYDISMAVPKFKVDENGNISANSLKLKYDDRAIQIVNTAEGEAIALPDSADAALRGLKVMGKTEQFKTNGYQLFDASIIDDTISQDGATVTNNGDGSFTIKGDGNIASGFYYEKSIDRQTLLKLFKVGKLTFNVGAKTVPRFTFALWSEIDTQLLVLSNSSSASASGTITQDILDNAYSAVICISDGGGSTVTSCTVKPMLYQDGDGTWEPYTGGEPAPNVNYPQPLVSVGDDGGVDVNVYGKNLFGDVRLSAGDLKTESSVPTTTNAYGTTINSVTYDGKIVVSQANVGNQTNVNSYTNGFFKMEIGRDYFIYGRTYTFIADMKVTANPLNISVTNGKMQLMTSSGTTSIQGSLSNGKLVAKFINVQSSTSPNDNSIEIRCAGMSFELTNIMLVEGDVTANLPNYEPFKPIQTLTIPTPNGLPAVPVSSDGNYTDASGQQWVCDEIDYNRGVYIKRVGEWRYIGGDLPYISSCITRPSGDILYFNIRIVGVSGKYSGYKNALCNSFITGNVLSVQNAICIIPGTNDYLYFSIKASDVGVAYGDGKTTDELKAIVREWMQNTFSEDNPLIAKYPLLEPTETPLSEAEINAYKELHTHYPNTSIHNSDNAHMAVDYVADTKNYVDNKIKKEVAELTAAILTQ